MMYTLTPSIPNVRYGHEVLLSSITIYFDKDNFQIVSISTRVAYTLAVWKTFFETRKVRTFRKLKYACCPCATVVMLNCLGLFRWSLSKRTTFIYVSPKRISPDALLALISTGIVQGLHVA